MQGSQNDFVIWWNCRINVRVIGHGVLKGCSSGSIVRISRVGVDYLLDKKSRRNPQIPSALISSSDK